MLRNLTKMFKAKASGNIIEELSVKKIIAFLFALTVLASAISIIIKPAASDEVTED